MIDTSHWSIDAGKTMAVVLLPPSNLVDYDLMYYLTQRFACVRKENTPTDLESKLNLLLSSLGKSDAEHFVICDHDMRPDAKADAMFEVEGDVVGCAYETGNKASWSLPWMFHSGFFRVSKKALARLTAPYVKFARDERGVRTGCLCKWLAVQAQEAGLLTLHAGWSEHGMARSWC